MESFGDLKSKHKICIYLVDDVFHENISKACDAFSPDVVVLENHEWGHEVLSFYYSTLCFRSSKFYCFARAIDVLNPMDHDGVAQGIYLCFIRLLSAAVINFHIIYFYTRASKDRLVL